MKVYVPQATNLSAAMKRVEIALLRHLPAGLEPVHYAPEADLVVMHVVGYPDTVAAIGGLRFGQRYALIQYCVRSTQEPSTRVWWPLWHHAELVWSYYDLERMCREDGVTNDFNFYHAPLGVDAEVFQPVPTVEKRYAIFTSGYVAETEGVIEARDACERLGKKMFHLGPIAGLGPNVVARHGIHDATLAEVYRSCDYVAGLRRCEGFELPAAEGLLCGARPICFDAPHYREWYDGSAYFVKEGAPADVSQQLEAVLREPPRPVTERELREVRHRFSWERIVGDFWTRVGEAA